MAKKRKTKKSDRPGNIIDFPGKSEGPNNSDIDRAEQEERQLHIITRAPAEEGFSATKEEVEEIMEHIIEVKGLAEDIIEELDLDDKSPESASKEIFCAAMETDDLELSVCLLEEALNYDPDNLDIKCQLAKWRGETPEEYIDHLTTLIAEAERGMGTKFITENKGMFWGLIETRPHMRAIGDMIDIQRDTGNTRDAIRNCEKLIELNPNDNQGIRYIAVALCLEEEMLESARKLFDEYELENSAFFNWTKVLERFLSDGPAAAEEDLKDAMNQNPHMLDFLTGKKRLGIYMPDFYSPGSFEEAKIAYDCQRKAWLKHKRIKKWVIKTVQNGQSRKDPGQSPLDM